MAHPKLKIETPVSLRGSLPLLLRRAELTDLVVCQITYDRKQVISSIQVFPDDTKLGLQGVYIHDGLLPWEDPGIIYTPDPKQACICIFLLANELGETNVSVNITIENEPNANRSFKFSIQKPSP